MARMRAALVFCLAAAWCGPAVAQRNTWKAKDFEPLTELPWKDEKATMAQVVERIFREPGMGVRYVVLDAYFRALPVAELGRAFDLSLSFEGSQTPDGLVSMLLRIWAQRDPVTAWERVRKLFHVVGIEHGWLNYDYWERPRIEVQDHAAIQRSPFWLRRSALEDFAIGCEKSHLPESERSKLLQEFHDEWLKRFGSPPKAKRADSIDDDDKAGTSFMLEAFNRSDSLEDIKTRYANIESSYVLAGRELAWRRWLMAHPKQMDELLNSLRDVNGSRVDVSIELLLLWRKLDREGMKAWASRPPDTFGFGDPWVAARSILIAEVEPELREKWLKEMLRGEEGPLNLGRLARWEPQLAMESAAMVEHDQLDLGELLECCAVGPWNGYLENTCSGLGYLMEHGTSHLPKSLHPGLADAWLDTVLLEFWGHVDVGETARFGLRTMLELKMPPTQELIEMYDGRQGSSDEAINDRTFCALRVWAVVRPDEMREWIKTVEGADMRKALTWLLEHPWGTGE
ncbi:hypothetical protein AYO49_05800 [Verrucomicrobiaceae bacterium SCGC AG-212-N21]|nr:hypothetical protein AYO49_05800 [Verrucomicrobiaceae bacterium SCGC AG-212-N21]